MEDTLTIPEEVQTEQQVPQEQQDPPSKKLYDGLVAEKLYSKSYDEFQKQFSTPESITKLHNGLVNQKLYSKNSNDFSTQFFPTIKKKEDGSLPSVKDNIQDYHELIKPPIIPKGQGINEPASTEVIQPKITASYDDYIAHHEERSAKKQQVKQQAIDKAAMDALKSKGIIKPGEENQSFDIHQFSELSKEKERLSDALKNKDALIAYKDGEPYLQEKGEGSVGGYIWNKITDAIGGMSSAAGDLTMQLLSKIPAARGGMTEEEMMKQYREESSPTIRTATTQLAGAEVSKEREKDYNGQFLTHAVGSLASMVPAMGFPKGSGFILQAYDSGLQNINNTEVGKNLPESTKTIYATGVGIATGFLMKLNLNTIFGKETNNVASGITANVISNFLKKSNEPITADAFEVAIQSAVKILKDKVIATGGKIGKGAITGGLFGSAMEATNIAAEEITNKATGQQVFEPTTWGEKFGRVLYGSAEMATIGGVLGGIQVPFSKTRDYIKEKVGEAKTPEDIQALKDELISKVSEKGHGEDAAQTVNDLVDKYVEVYSKIPPEANNKSAIVDNIQERDALVNQIDEKTQQLQIVDPAFHEPILKEINAANGRVDEINKEIAEKAEKPQPPDEKPSIVTQEPQSFPEPTFIGGESETKPQPSTVKSEEVFGDESLKQVEGLPEGYGKVGINKDKEGDYYAYYELEQGISGGLSGPHDTYEQARNDGERLMRRKYLKQNPDKQLPPSETKPITQNEEAKAAEVPITETKGSTSNEPPNKNIPTTGEGTGEEDTTSIKNEITGNRREELGLKKADEVIKKEFGTSWDEAKQKIDKGFNTQDLVDELKKKPRAINDVEDALLLHHQNSKEIELMDTNDFINKASESGNESDLAEGRIRRARILDELQDIYDVNKAAGAETARGLSARRMMTDRKYNLVNMMAEKRASNDGKPLSPEQEKDVEALHNKIKETKKVYDDYVKEAEAEIKGLQEKILGKKVVNKKSAANKLREWADKLDEKTKGQTLATIIPITPKMISGAMRLIADGLEKGGEVLDLIKQAIEEIKKGSPDIDEAKLTKAINKEIIDSGITIPTVKEKKDLTGIALDRKLLKLKADAQRAKDDADISLKKEEEKKRTGSQKLQDTFIKWQRAFKLSNPVTMGKLVMAGTTRLAMTPLEDVVGGGYSKLLPKLAKGAIGEGGGLNVKETAEAYKNGIIEGMKDAAAIMKRGGQGKSDLDVVFGKAGYLPPEAIDFFGQLHSATKAPFKRFMFERSLSKRLRRNIANGVDVSDPLVQTEIAISAYKDANRAIFMQDNKVTTGWQKMVNYFDTVDKATGKAPSKPIATTLQFLVPFVKVPTNIAAEIGTNVYGVPVGIAKIVHATFTKGLEKLPAEEKDIILRNLKKGTLGLAALSLGYFNPQLFGGYYQDKEKRKPEDAKAGAFKIGGINIPAWLIESPIFQTMQVGATVRRVKDAKVKGETKGITEGVWAGALGMAEHVPMLDQPLRIFNAIKDEKERNWYVGELAKGTLEPSLLQKVAEWTDSAEKRVPKDLKEHVEMGIPGLRQNVTEKIVTTNKFSDKTQKFLEEKNVQLSKTNFTYREEGKQIYMTQEQATKFNNLRNEYIDSEVKKIPDTKYDITEENSSGVIVKSAQVLGKDLDKYIDKEEGKTELQKKIDAISKKATELAKTKMGLEKTKNEVLVEEH